MSLNAPFRDARYAPRQLEITDRGGGEVLLDNPTPFDQRFQIMTAALAHHAQAAAPRVWLAERSGDGWRKLSYGEGYEAVCAIAGGLRDLAIAWTGPLLILARNGIDHALFQYAAMGQGIAVAPVSPQYGLPGAHLARLEQAVQTLLPSAVYTEDAALFSTALEAPCLAGLPVVAGKNARPGDITLSSLLQARGIAPVAQPHETARYLLTSGSTGHPKAVICTHRATALNAAQVTACFDDPEPPVMVNSSPWSHSLGATAILQMVTHRGGTLHIDAGQPTQSGFGETLRNLKEVSPTYQNMVPAGWMLFAAALERDGDLARRFFEKVRVLQYGGAALGQDVNDRIQAVAVATVGEKISFASGYGATETGPTAANVHWHNDTMGLMGLPVPGTSIKLVKTGDKLEFRVKGPQVAPGYLGQPELSAQCFDEEGYYRIGDAARWVEPGRPEAGLAFDGRLSENFKLTNGTFVAVGDLRIRAIGAVGDAVTDAVVCGEGKDQVGLMFYPNPSLSHEVVRQRVEAGLVQLNGASARSTTHVARALVLAGPPDAAVGEITDKGYIAQALARSLHREHVERLFANPLPEHVMEFSR